MNAATEGGRRDVVSKEKLEVATKRFSEYLSFLVPVNYKPKDWIKEIEKIGDIPGDIFECIYRCYHQSFKVMRMQVITGNFVDMVAYLFADKIKVDYFDTPKYENWLGFPKVLFTLVGGKEDKFKMIDHLDKVFRAKTHTYSILYDVLSREPVHPESYWQDWQPSHLTLMGGTFFSLICSISVLGMLQRYIKKDYKPYGIITYPDGVSNYLLGGVNFEYLQKEVRGR